MIKVWLLRLHRWAALLFALPLAVVLVTGLILAFEPMLMIGGIKPGSVDAVRIERLLARHDPGGKARAVALRSYADVLILSAGRGNSTAVDLRTDAVVPDAGALATLFQTSRRMHETLLLEARLLVVTSTFAMLGLIAVGILMGLPRWRNSVAGWHKGIAWVLLPLLILSPLTGLAIYYRVTFTAPPTRDGGPPAPSLTEAIRIVGSAHDLSTLVMLRAGGGRTTARLVENGEYRTYTVTPGGLEPTPRNWPRLLHEGNWQGYLSALLNVVTAAALIALLGTGLYLWGYRQARRLANRRERSAAAVAGRP